MRLKAAAVTLVAVTAVLAVTGSTAHGAAHPTPVPGSGPRDPAEALAAGDVAQAAQTLVQDGARSAIATVRDNGRLSSAATPAVVAPATRPFRIGSATKLFTATLI